MKKFILTFIVGGIVSIAGSSFLFLCFIGWLLEKLEKHPTAMEEIKTEIADAISSAIARLVYNDARPASSPVVNYVPYQRVRDPRFRQDRRHSRETNKEA